VLTSRSTPEPMLPRQRPGTHCPVARRALSSISLAQISVAFLVLFARVDVSNHRQNNRRKFCREHAGIAPTSRCLHHHRPHRGHERPVIEQGSRNQRISETYTRKLAFAHEAEKRKVTNNAKKWHRTSHHIAEVAQKLILGKHSASVKATFSRSFAMAAWR